MAHKSICAWPIPQSENSCTYQLYTISLIFSDDEWPSGSYGLPRPKSGCPNGEQNGWYEGWRFQDMEDDSKNTSTRSRASSGSHMDVKFIGDKRDVKRTFCMKENAAIETRFCPFIKGKVSSLYVYTD